MPQTEKQQEAMPGGWLPTPGPDPDPDPLPGLQQAARRPAAHYVYTNEPPAVPSEFLLDLRVVFHQGEPFPFPMHQQTY